MEFNMIKQPLNEMVFFACNGSRQIVTVIKNKKDVEFSVNYNEISELSFSLAKASNDASYDLLQTARYIYSKDIGYFVIEEVSETITSHHSEKKVKCYSAERELCYLDFVLPRDIYRLAGATNSLASMLFPAGSRWQLIGFDASLANSYRTIEYDGTLFDFCKNVLQEAFGCLFCFDCEHFTVYIKDVLTQGANLPVFYISNDNIAKTITLDENFKEAITKLYVQPIGAVDISNSNPIGGAYLYNFDYICETKNVSDFAAELYWAWKQEIKAKTPEWASLSAKSAICISNIARYNAEKTEINNKLAELQHLRGVYLEAQQSLGTDMSEELAQNQLEIDAENAKLAETNQSLDEATANLSALQSQRESIVAILNPASFFGETFEEFEPFLRVGALDVPDSFINSHQLQGQGASNVGCTLHYYDGDFEQVQDASGFIFVNAKGGTLQFCDITASVRRLYLEQSEGDRFLITAILMDGQAGGNSFASATLTIEMQNGILTSDAVNSDIAFVLHGSTFTIANATSNYTVTSTSELLASFAVSEEIYDFATKESNALARPNYSFSIDSANIAALPAFKTQLDHLRFGDCFAIRADEKRLILPIFIGIRIANEKTEFVFSNKFKRFGDTADLCDLLLEGVRTSAESKRKSDVSYSYITQNKDNLDALVSDGLIIRDPIRVRNESESLVWDTSGIRTQHLLLNETALFYGDRVIAGEVVTKSGLRVHALNAETLVGKITLGDRVWMGGIFDMDDLVVINHPFVDKEELDALAERVDELESRIETIEIELAEFAEELEHLQEEIDNLTSDLTAHTSNNNIHLTSDEKTWLGNRQVVDDHIANQGIHVTSDEKTWLGEPYAIGSYTGTGTSARNIALGFQPRYARVWVSAAMRGPMELNSAGNGIDVYTADATRDGGSLGLSIITSGIQIRGALAYGTTTARLNTTGYTYYFIAYH